MALQAVNKIVFFQDRKGTWQQVDDATPTDGVFVIQVGTEKFKKVIEGSVKAEQCGIYGDGTDQTAKLQAALNHADVHELVFDGYNKSIVVNGTVRVPEGTVLKFRNKCKITGTGTITSTLDGNGNPKMGAIIDCDDKKQCFAPTVAVQYLKNSKVSVVWFGAKADCEFTEEVGPTDNLIPFQRAIASLYEWNGSDIFSFKYTRRLYVPAQHNKSYYLSGELILSGNLEFYGDGMQSTIMNWPRGVKGLILPTSSYPVEGYYTPTQQARYCWLHDFTIQGFKAVGGYYPGYFDNVSHGLCLYGGEHVIERVLVQAWRGHGIYNYGGNESKFNNVHANYNAGDGFHFENADSNANVLSLCYAKYNGRFGFYDISFLGNVGIGCTTAGNASDNPFNRTHVYGGSPGVDYTCIKPCKGINPGVTPGWETYWRLTPSIGYGNKLFDPAVDYVPGGAFRVEGDNQLGLWIGGYSEGDQYTGDCFGSSIVYGGFASSVNGAMIKGTGGNPIFQNITVRNDEEGVDTVLRKGDNTIGWLDSSDGNYHGWRYDKSTKNIVPAWGSGPYWMAANPYLTGRSSLPSNSVLMAGPSLFLGVLGTTSGRNICFADNVPTSGKWGDGDLIFKYNHDGITLGWQCKTAGDFAGTPPVFQAIPFPGTGGGGSATTINNNGNNKIITGSGTANTLEAETNFTYDGQTIRNTTYGGVNAKFVVESAGSFGAGADGAEFELINSTTGAGNSKLRVYANAYGGGRVDMQATDAGGSVPRDLNFGGVNGTLATGKRVKFNFEKVSFPGILEYADNAAALAAGLDIGDVYRTGDLLKIVHSAL